LIKKAITLRLVARCLFIFNDNERLSQPGAWTVWKVILQHVFVRVPVAENTSKNTKHNSIVCFLSQKGNQTSSLREAVTVSVSKYVQYINSK
jgi:hypothetical protein